MRRALRIFPLFYGFFFVLFLLKLFLRGHADHLFWTYLFYVPNLFQGIDPAHNPTVINLALFSTPIDYSVGYLWSLCVEEHFYLVWPLVVYLARSRKSLMRIAVCGMVLTFLLRCWAFRYPDLHFAIYTATPFRCDGLLLGAWVALWLRGREFTSKQLHRVCYGFGIPATAILLVGDACTYHRRPEKLDNPFFATVGYSLIALIAACLVVLALDPQSWMSRLGKLRPLAALGVVSYGFYVLHDFPVNGLAWKFGHTSRPIQAAYIIVLFFLTYGTAWLSFRYLESPPLRLKRVLAPSPSAATRAGKEPIAAGRI